MHSAIYQPLFLGLIELTHLPLDEMAAILQTIFQMHFREWIFLYFD